MEIYLSHMFVFRVLEKLHLNTVIGDGWLQYVVTLMSVTVGSIVFAVIVQRIIKKFKDKVDRRTVAK